MLLAGDPAHAAPSATEKCQQAKLKAQVQLRYCLSKNEAGLLVGKPDQAAACRDKFAAAYCTATALPPSQHWDVSFFPPPGFALNFQTLTGSFNPVRAVRGGL